MKRYWFVSTKSEQHSYLALMTIILAIFVILLGAYTRLTDAGLSCPDWPNCYGYLTAPHTDAQIEVAAKRYPDTPINVTKAWTEMTHRYAAGAEGLLIILLVLSILRNHQTKNSKVFLMSIGLIVLLFVQVFLGMLTVTAKLKPIIVLAHLLTGLSLLSILWCLYLNLKNRNVNLIHSRNQSLLPWLWLALLLIFLQITLGGWVSTHHAGLACIDFPYCNGEILPKIQWGNLSGDLIIIHMLHRLGAVITVAYCMILAGSLLLKPTFNSFAYLIFALVGLQITLGILNIIWLRPVWIALIHQGVAIFLLLTVITILNKVYMQHKAGYVLYT